MMHKLKELKISLLDVFSDGFSSFRNGVSGKFSGEDELDGWLDLTRGECSSLVESNELWSFSGDSVESVVDERVHDVHGLLWDSDVGVHLLEDFVDIDGEGLHSSSSGFSVGTFGGCWFFSHLNDKFSDKLIPRNSKLNTDLISRKL